MVGEGKTPAHFKKTVPVFLFSKLAI